MAGALTAAAPSLEDQIRQRWGGYGDWKSAGQDQVTALAGLLRINGVTDLDKLQLKARDFTIKTPAGIVDGEAPYAIEAGEQKGTAFDASYDGQELAFLGNVNRDGSVTKGARDAGDAAEYGQLNNGNQLGWSSQGDGATSFVVRMNEDGEPVIVPTWESSKAKTLEDVRGLATLAAVAVGGVMAAGSAGAGAGAAAGGSGAGAGAAATGLNWSAIGTAAAKSAAMNAGMTLVQGGSFKDALKSGAIGAVTGGVGGGLASAGVNPIVAGAATGATGAALRGGSGKDILLGGGIGALSTYAKTEGFTGNSNVDQALVKAGTTLARGGSAKDALLAGGTNLLTSSSSGNRLDGGSSIDEALNEDNIVRFDSAGANGMDDYDPLYDPSFTNAFDAANGQAMDGGFQTGDPEVDPYGADSGRGGDTLSNMGANNDTGPSAFDKMAGFYKSLFGGSGSGGSSYMNGSFGRDLMTLLGYGIQSYGQNKSAEDQRNYLDQKDADRRRRQMPVGALPAMKMTAVRGGA